MRFAAARRHLKVSAIALLSRGSGVPAEPPAQVGREEKGLIRSRTQTGLLAADRAATKERSGETRSVGATRQPASI